MDNREKEKSIDYHEMELLTENLPIDLDKGEQLFNVVEKNLVKYNQHMQFNYQNIYDNIYY